MFAKFARQGVNQPYTFSEIAKQCGGLGADSAHAEEYHLFEQSVLEWVFDNLGDDGKAFESIWSATIAMVV